MSNDKNLKALEEEQKRELRRFQAYKTISESKQAASTPKNDLFQFFIGLVILGVGLFWVFQTAQVRSTWGNSIFSIGSWNAPNGVIIIPFIIGIVMLFMMEKKIFGWIVTTIGVLGILLAIIMSVRIEFVRTSLLSYVLMFGFIAAGGGLIMKSLFFQRK
ncbi:MAG TPA: hypothetical protein GX710_02615 [Clostridiales bacterium]|nr:hypothetical protein [Clostridiales bacterium]